MSLARKVLVSIFTVTAVSVFLSTTFYSNSVGALSEAACNATKNAGSTICKSADEDNLDGQGGFISVITNTILFVAGIAAVIAIVLGGIKYASANGEAQKITSAKNTIMYSVIGLIITIMAWGIVQFVVTSVAGSQGGGNSGGNGSTQTFKRRDQSEDIS